jgi:hypothetical protein
MTDTSSAKPEYSSTLTYLFSSVNASISKHFPNFSQPLCQAHDVCWCEECLMEYKTTRFTMFRNSCEHFDAQCQEVSFSVQHINQLQLILKYADHLEAAEEAEIIRHLDSLEGNDDMSGCEGIDVTGR